MTIPTLKIAVFAGGCFWCTEAVFQRLKGVHKVESGYTGGHLENPTYSEVTTGTTKHAEAIQVSYDSAQISYIELLEVFFMTHDPTTLNRQGADQGTHYRSAIFYTNPQQEKMAKEQIQLLNDQMVFETNIVTEVTPLGVFYKAETYHQNYYNQNNNQSYCQFVIQPKLLKLEQFFTHKLK